MERWRTGFARSSAAPTDRLIAGLRAVLRDGLRSHQALPLVDDWISVDGADRAAAAQAAAAVDALLGIR